jgi:thioredoxin reductase
VDKTGYMQTVPGSSKTNIAALFAAGDVLGKIYRQAMSAAGSGRTHLQGVTHSCSWLKRGRPFKTPAS